MVILLYATYEAGRSPDYDQKERWASGVQDTSSSNTAGYQDTNKDAGKSPGCPRYFSRGRSVDYEVALA
jgi:hypothetical protein